MTKASALAGTRNCANAAAVTKRLERLSERCLGSFAVYANAAVKKLDRLDDRVDAARKFIARVQESGLDDNEKLAEVATARVFVSLCESLDRLYLQAKAHQELGEIHMSRINVAADKLLREQHVFSEDFSDSQWPPDKKLRERTVETKQTKAENLYERIVQTLGSSPDELGVGMPGPN